MVSVQNYSRILIESTTFIGIAALAGSTPIVKHFPGASLKGLLLSGGLGAATIVSNEWMFSGEECDRNRRICITAGLLFSAILAPTYCKSADRAC